MAALASRRVSSRKVPLDGPVDGVGGDARELGHAGGTEVARQRQDGCVEVAAVLQVGMTGGGPAGVGEVGQELALPVDLDEQLGQRHDRQARHDRVPLGEDRRVQDFGAEGLEVELAVRVEAGRAVGFHQHRLEVIEVAMGLSVDGGEPLGDGGRHARELQDLGALGRPCLERNEVGGGVGVAPRTLHPELTRAQACPEGEEDAQLPAVLEPVLVGRFQARSWHGPLGPIADKIMRFLELFDQGLDLLYHLRRVVVGDLAEQLLTTVARCQDGVDDLSHGGLLRVHLDQFVLVEREVPASRKNADAGLGKVVGDLDHTAIAQLAIEMSVS